MKVASKPVPQVIAAIEALDLEPIKMKLMDPEEGPGWSRPHADRMETAYKRFLTLLVRFPEAPLAPTKDVDKFWHGHILDTIKYAEDCEKTFGYFLHHFPYFGMRGEQDAADLRAAAARMHEIYEREFGEAMPNGTSWCTAAAPAAATAWCTAAQPKQPAAWCTTAHATQGSAWCTTAKPLVESTTAWCTAAVRAA